MISKSKDWRAMAVNKKPNILYIFSDQHRKFDLGCYGHNFVKTPNIDKLANEGLRFEHCISNSPVCVPARGTLLTGLFAGKHKAFTNDIAIDTTCVGIGDVLKSVGYHTGYFGKWHLGGIPRDQAITKEKRLGFEEWKVANCNHNYLDTYYYDEDNVKHNIEGYEPEIFGGLAVDFIENNKDSEKPWALYLSFATPHDPFEHITKKYLDEYENIDITLRENVKEEVRFTASKRKKIEEYTQMTRGYFGHISAIDTQIGFIVEKLRGTGQLDNTIIMYSADHGDMLGSQGEKDKQVAYEESIAIPLIAYWKNNIYKGVCEELIGLNDIPVTIASLAGAEFACEVDGEDLKDLFLRPNSLSYESAYLYDYFPCHQAEIKKMEAWRGIRTKRYTYAVTAKNLDFMLFDNDVDPYQLNNLAGNEDYKEVQEKLWQMLKMHIDKHDRLLDGLDYVKYSGQIEEFNKSQRHFNKTVLVQE